MQAKHKVFLLSFCTVLLWASAFPLTKVVQEQFTSNPLGFLRCSIAAIFLIDLKEGDRIFTWYDVVAESYPAQASVNRVVVVPAAEDAEEDTETAASPVKISYSKSEMTTKDDVTCVPLRETADALGLTLTWDRDSRTATLESDTRAMDRSESI